MPRNWLARNDKPIDSLDAALQRAFPEYPPDRIADLRDKLLEYVVSGVNEGFDLALIKRSRAGKTILRILELNEEDI